MGIAGVKIKVMPTSPDVNLEELQDKIKKIVEDKQGKNREYVEEPVAFGLKAVIAFFEWDEQNDSEEIANKITEIEEVNSAQVIDVRRLVQ
jgi:elongation factor 1-beta